MKYKVEFAEFHKIEIEADSKEEAEDWRDIWLT